MKAGEVIAGTVCPAVEQVPVVRARHSVRVWIVASLETMAKTITMTITMPIAKRRGERVFV